MASSGITNPTPLSRRRTYESLTQKFGTFSRGLSPEEQQALAAILQQAVHAAEVAGFPRTGDGIGALLYGALRATQTSTG
jgi:hypothetical protein